MELDSERAEEKMSAGGGHVDLSGLDAKHSYFVSRNDLSSDSKLES